MEGSILKQLVGIIDLFGRVSVTRFVLQVGKENGRHDGIGRFWGENFIRFEIWHAFIGPCKRAVLHHRSCRRGRGNVRRNNASIVTCYNSTPMLHPFGQCIVWSLCHTDSYICVAMTVRAKDSMSPIVSIFCLVCKNSQAIKVRTVHNVVVTTFSRHWLSRILSQELATTQKIHQNT
jgi:hypothetical protein